MSTINCNKIISLKYSKRFKHHKHGREFSLVKRSETLMAANGSSCADEPGETKDVVVSAFTTNI